MIRLARRDMLVATLCWTASATLAPAEAGDADVNAIIRSLAPIRGQKRGEGYDADHPPPPDYWGDTREEPDVEGERIVVVPSRAIDLEVYFDFDSAALTGRTRADLRALGRALASPELRPWRYLVAGHTDAVGDPDYNLALSGRRARAVCDYLVTAYPIDPWRLRWIGYGSRRLKRPGRPTAAINRRVEVVLILPESRRRPPDGPPSPPPSVEQPGRDFVPGAPIGPDGKPTMRW